jgi:hypothetical protein
MHLRRLGSIVDDRSIDRCYRLRPQPKLRTYQVLSCAELSHDAVGFASFPTATFATVLLLLLQHI